MITSYFWRVNSVYGKYIRRRVDILGAFQSFHGVVECNVIDGAFW